MIEMNLSIPLPTPWAGGAFQTDCIGSVNFLVGPNGSGKSQFAKELVRHLPNARLLGTDRLSGMEQARPFADVFGDHFSNGLRKNQFPNFKRPESLGSGISTLVILEERMELRIQLEAVLGTLFNREIILEWDSGNLIAKARRRDDSATYRLDREECHGIKELCVLLTHLYDDQLPSLIIDEPELNLHPQYQAFFMREVRKVVGDRSKDNRKKLVFLITHSPFILDFKSQDDLQSVISFGLDYSVPRRWSPSVSSPSSTQSLVSRLNSHQKQLFFSDNPIFVEGVLDAQMISALMEARGVAVEAAGSCIIDAGGVEEVNHYLQLCQGLGKKAHFLYDLDSLFRGRLRSSVKEDETVQGFLATAGLGNDFAKYCGELDSKLTGLVDRILIASLPEPLETLSLYLHGLGNRPAWSRDEFAKARVAVLTAISRYRNEIVSVVGEVDVSDIEGRRNQIVSLLQQKNIHLLPGGTLERYLPLYEGDHYSLSEGSKQKAVQAELDYLASPRAIEALANRYGDLYDAVCSLPSSPDVDIDPVVRSYLCDYVHELQKAVVANPRWQHDQIQQRLNAVKPEMARVFSIRSFERTVGKEDFCATIEVREMLGIQKRVTHVNEKTNAGMGDFVLTAA